MTAELDWLEDRVERLTARLYAAERHNARLRLALALYRGVDRKAGACECGKPLAVGYLPGETSPAWCYDCGYVADQL